MTAYHRVIVFLDSYNLLVVLCSEIPQVFLYGRLCQFESSSFVSAMNLEDEYSDREMSDTKLLMIQALCLV